MSSPLMWQTGATAAAVQGTRTGTLQADGAGDYPQHVVQQELSHLQLGQGNLCCAQGSGVM